jgi:2-oxoglutarate ferredoxin oxidoreductase subunit alpha
VLLPEMNLGQLAMLLRAKFLVDITSYTQLRGLPFRSEDLVEAIASVMSSEIPSQHDGGESK